MKAPPAATSERGTSQTCLRRSCRWAEPTFADACVAAGEAVPLFAVSIQPDAEDHEDDPAGGADARDEGRLLDHVRDLLRQGVLLAYGLGHAAGGI